MKRIDIIYGGQLYSIGGRSLESVTDEIERAVASGGAWLVVNDGEGERREARLFIGAGVPVAVVPIPDQGTPLPQDPTMRQDSQ